MIPENSIGIMDRGFASWEFFDEMSLAKTMFVVRIKNNMKTGFDLEVLKSRLSGRKSEQDTINFFRRLNLRAESKQRDFLAFVCLFLYKTREVDRDWLSLD